MIELKTAHFRFYEELNDFLPEEKKKLSFAYHFSGRPAIKDSIEALGVPHGEVDLILANGVSVDFSYQLNDNDEISIYPQFEALDISPIVRLRPQPLRQVKFILDVHLGKLAKYLRVLGFDTLYENHYSDSEIIDIAQKEHRIILTRDLALLKDGRVTHGYWMRSTDLEKQVREVIEHFDLTSLISPFHRCLECNGRLSEIEKEAILPEVPERVVNQYDHFYSCERCKKNYWKGSHYENILKTLESWGIKGDS